VLNHNPKRKIVMPQPPTILIIDDDLTLGRSLKRLTQQAFSDFKVLWARNGVAAMKIAHEYAATLRLVVLNVDLPLLDGILVAAHLRALVPGVPIMPFTWKRRCRHC
jgi:DNA-binding response OmpR family regulator